MAPRALTLALAGLALCALAGHACALQLRATKTNGWQARRSAPADRVISITVGLRTRNLDALEQTLWAVSDPRSPDYGRFLSATQVRALIAPQEAVVARVEAWLRAAPALTLERGACGDVLLARLTVAAAERLVGARFSEFAHPERPLTASGEPYTIARTTEQLALPDFVADAVDYLGGVANFPPLPHRLAKRRDDDGEPGINVTPPVLFEQYGVPATPLASNANSSQAVAEFEQDSYYESDIPAFQKMFNLSLVVPTQVGWNDPSKGYLGESSLDLEYITAVGNGVPTWDFYQDELDIVSWGTRISSYPHAPLVHSISWGSGESNYDADTLAKSNAEFLKLGTMGFSVFCAAGDAGTGHTGVFQCGHFDPTFPASSPYVVAVGGTFVQVAGGNETAWSGTGGGFSAVYARPPYQAAAAASYLAQPGLPSTQFYNSSGRVLPDVAALATNYQVLVENYLGPLTGTSAATPVWAALVAVFNGARAARGMPPMGFVNPWLYQLKDGVGTDVLAGNNRASPCPAGFPATPGFDAVSGLGTPLFEQLLAAALEPEAALRS